MTMAKDFDRILDECIDRMNRGERMEACLAEYPEHARQLEPLLRAVTQTKAVYSFSPAAEAKKRRDSVFTLLWTDKGSRLYGKRYFPGGGPGQRCPACSLSYLSGTSP